MINMAHGGFQQRLRRRFAIFSCRSFSSDPALTPMRIGMFYRAHSQLPCEYALHYRYCQVNTQTIDAVFRYFQRNAIVEWMSATSGTLTRCLMSLNASARPSSVRRHGRYQRQRVPAPYLIDRCFDICRTRIGHGLYGMGAPSPIGTFPT